MVPSFKVVAFLAHESCPSNGGLFELGAGKHLLLSSSLSLPRVSSLCHWPLKKIVRSISVWEGESKSACVLCVYVCVCVWFCYLVTLFSFLWSLLYQVMSLPFDGSAQRDNFSRMKALYALFDLIFMLVSVSILRLIPSYLFRVSSFSPEAVSSSFDKVTDFDNGETQHPQDANSSINNVMSAMEAAKSQPTAGNTVSYWLSRSACMLLLSLVSFGYVSYAFLNLLVSSLSSPSAEPLDQRRG